MQYSAADESLPLNVFVGLSASKCNVSDSDARFVFDRETCLSIPNMAWDVDNMKCVRQWNYSIQFPAMETLADGNFADFNCFAIKWSAYHDCSRRTLSADSIYLGSNPLGKLTVVIPVVQFHGSTAMSISGIVTDSDYFF